MSKFRVLSLDGGGVRGLFTALLLERLCREPGLEHAFDHVDLIAGNSSGALIALGMAQGLGQDAEIATLIGTRQAFEKAREVFGPPRLPRPLDWLPWVLFSKYTNAAREKAVKKFLKPETRLRDLKTNVLITSFDLDNKEALASSGSSGPRMWKPKIFHNFIGPNSDRDIFAWQAALYSTAALTYFPSVDGYVDGGIYANNPSMCALAQIFDARYEPKPKPALNDVVMLSIGAGLNLDFVSGQKVWWGLLPWVWNGRFVSVSTDATVGVAEYECRQLLSDENFRRLNPKLGMGKPIPLDDFDSLQLIRDRLDDEEVAAEIKECADWLKEHWMPGLKKGPLLTETTSKHVDAATELTCVMPIKPGFLPVLDTRTYATRLRAVFKVLQTLRSVSRELKSHKPVLDIVEAARTVHSFSWAILKEQNLLLQVTFDRPWEPYIRVVWKDLGPLLDLFLCNCEGFVPSSEGFEAFSGFVREHQVEANFFYPPQSLTIDDQTYLIQAEKLQREGKATAVATLVPTGPVERTQADSVLDPNEAARQWLAVLDVLYGLRMFYPDDSPDRVYLLRAATALLRTSRPKWPLPPSDALTWFESLGEEKEPQFEPRRLKPELVQGGIQRPYRQIAHGCLILARVDDPRKARTFIGDLKVTNGSGDRKNGHPEKGADAKPGDTYTNVALTFNGLRRLGVKESVLAHFPKEFREGMEARAGLLGDVRENHPEKWMLPAWTPPVKPPLEVPMSTVDVVFTRNMVGAKDDGSPSPDWDSAVGKFREELQSHGFQVLAVEQLRRLRPDKEKRTPGDRLTRDHFGFIDGISQPNATDVPKERDDVALGEIFVGYQNQRKDPPFPKKDPAAPWEQGSLIDNGSFLVVRKLRQYRKRLDDVLEKGATPGMSQDQLLAKMVGRNRDGDPLADVHGTQKPTNDFDFGKDLGIRCPFHAHIRRGNPRLLPKEANVPGQPLVPRIARRSLVYGPSYDKQHPDDKDRGVMFMAYNASIAEQFEVLQRWMTGGNTPAGGGNTGVYSRQPDPLLGLPDDDGTRFYRFVDEHGTVHSVNLGDPFVTLQWGLYLFAPSIPGLTELSEEDPKPDVDYGLAAVALGQRVIDDLKSEKDWARVIEDGSMNLSGVTAAVMATIRNRYNGVLRTPYGVIVAKHDLAMQVLKSDPTFSVCEYQRRFGRSVGEGYLGMDHGAAYKELSTRANRPVENFDTEQAFTEAHKVTTDELQRQIRMAAELAGKVPGIPEDPLLSIPLEPVVDYVLAKLAQKWFDLPDDKLIRIGNRPLPNSKEVHCPFSFLAPSRYVFSSPNPRDKVRELGEGNGQRLLEKARQFVRERRAQEKSEGDPGLKGEISRALFKDIKGDDDLLARTLLGLIFGFVPTVYGNALAVLGTWISDQTLLRVQQHLLSADRSHLHRAATCAIWEDVARAMLGRPVPPLLHRKVTEPVTLGEVELKENDRVVIGMLGVTQGILLEERKLDIMPIFGGDRKVAGHPTHACPGYGLAMGVLYGLLTAVLELGQMRPGAALQTIRVPNPYLKP